LGFAVSTDMTWARVKEPEPIVRLVTASWWFRKHPFVNGQMDGCGSYWSPAAEPTLRVGVLGVTALLAALTIFGRESRCEAGTAEREIRPWDQHCDRGRESATGPLLFSLLD